MLVKVFSFIAFVLAIVGQRLLALSADALLPAKVLLVECQRRRGHFPVDETSYLEI